MARRNRAQEVLDKFRAGKLSRRDFNKALGAAGLGLVTMPLVANRARAAAEDLHIFEWAGYEIPELHPSYIEKHGGSPAVSHFGEASRRTPRLCRASLRASSPNSVSDSPASRFTFNGGWVAPKKNDVGSDSNVAHCVAAHFLKEREQ